MREQTLPPGVKVLGAITAEYAEILSSDALEFLAKLHRQFNVRRLELLARGGDNPRRKLVASETSNPTY
jgi:malate synthase